jgi:cysteine-rich repeat protein
VWIVGVALACAGCVAPNLVDCGDGTACPVSNVCDTAHHTCVSPEQISICDGQDEFSVCMTTALTGRCFGGVCMSSGCGNAIKEPDEACDDGNTDDGDGCSHDCGSLETCGNNIKDPGEGCDDGNLVSHDGCDSACEVEARIWDLIGISPTNPTRHNSVWNPVTKHVVTVEAPFVWEWDGVAASWSIVGRSVPTNLDPSYQVVYDAKRDRIVAIDQKQLLEWDGATWTSRVITGQSADGLLSATYFPDKESLFVVGNKQGQLAGFTIPSDAPAWTMSDLPARSLTAGTDVIAAYDATALDLVVIISGLGGEADRHTPTGWVKAGAPKDNYAGFNVTYDPIRNAIVAFGGYSLADSTPLYAGFTLNWSDGKWTQWSNEFSKGRSTAMAWADGVTLYAAGGSAIADDGGQTSTDSLISIDPLVDETPLKPTATVRWVAALPEERALLAVAVDGTTWKFTDHWMKLAPVHPALATSWSGVYDPVRGGVLAWDRITLKTSLYANGDWTDLDVAVTNNSCFPLDSITYDYANTREIGWASGKTCVLSSTGGAWQQLTFVATFGGSATIGYDAIARHAVLLDSSASVEGLYDIADAPTQMNAFQWVKSLSPGANYRVISNLDYGSLNLVPTVANLPLWQRRTETWHNLGPPPAVFDGLGVAVRGRAMLLAGGARVVEIFGFDDGAPVESCSPGEDADGDGAMGCADRDCWATCTPLCPPVDPSCNPL